MRLARVITAHNQHEPTLDQSIEAWELDVLQLDYAWKPRYFLDRKERWKTFAHGFLPQLQTLHRLLYLDPNLHVVTNAGGFATLGCMEAAGQFCCENGNRELPLTAIRGDNVFSQLEELIAAGIELQDSATGTRVQDLTQPLLSAQVELGAGPLATALSEGSRLVVAGCYDSAAPMLASAIAGTRWTWEQSNELANLAAASHLPGVLIEIDEQSQITLRNVAQKDRNTDQLRQNLLEKTTAKGLLEHADVHCRLSDCQLAHTEFNTVELNGITGEAASGHWKLRLTYAGNYLVQAIVKCRGGQEVGSAIVEELVDSLNQDQDGRRKITIDTLSSATERPSSLFRIRCSSASREPCEAFIRELSNLTTRDTIEGLESCETLSLQQEANQIFCNVPRDAIAVSVDTRPANEWI